MLHAESFKQNENTEFERKIWGNSKYKLFVGYKQDLSPLPNTLRSNILKVISIFDADKWMSQTPNIYG